MKSILDIFLKVFISLLVVFFFKISPFDSITPPLISTILDAILTVVIILTLQHLIYPYTVDKKTNVYAPFMPVTLTIMFFLGIAAIVSFFIKIYNYEFIILLFVLLFAFNLVWTMLIYHQYSKEENNYNFSPEKFWIALFGKIRVKEDPFCFLIIYSPAVSDKLEIFENSVKKQSEWKITIKKFDCQDKKDLEENNKHKQELNCILFPEKFERKIFSKEKKSTTESVSGIIILHTDDTLDDTLKLVAKWAKLHISQPIFCVNYSKTKKPPYTFKSIQNEDRYLKNAWVDMLVYGVNRGKASDKVVNSNRTYLIGLFCVTLLLFVFSVFFFSDMRKEINDNVKIRESKKNLFVYVPYNEIFNSGIFKNEKFNKEEFFNNRTNNYLYKIIGKNTIPEGLSVSFWEIEGNKISNVGIAGTNRDTTPFEIDTISIIGSSFKNPGYFIIWERPNNRKYTDRDTVYYYNLRSVGNEGFTTIKKRDKDTGDLTVYKIKKDSSFFEAKFITRDVMDSFKNYVLCYSIKRNDNSHQIGVCIEVFKDYTGDTDFLYTLKTRTILWEAVNEFMIYNKMFENLLKK